jgi:dihydrofolate reductase
MSITCSVYIATSVDGFIATLEGGLEWLERPEYSAVPIKGLSYQEFIEGIDGIVMGRKTFEKVLSFEEWPYQGISVFVLSASRTVVPAHLQGKAEFIHGTPEQVVQALRARGMRHLYIDGGLTVQGFLKANLVHEMTITRIPVLLGEGIPLFGKLDSPIILTLVEVSVSDSGIVQERYKVRSVD